MPTSKFSQTHFLTAIAALGAKRAGSQHSSATKAESAWNSIDRTGVLPGYTYLHGPLDDLMNGDNFRAAQAQAIDQGCQILTYRIRELIPMNPPVHELNMLMAQVQELSGSLAFSGPDARDASRMTAELGNLTKEVDRMSAYLKEASLRAVGFAG